MEQGRPDYWFAVKRRGWGWGLPVRWQGWAVLALYFGSMYCAIRYFPPRASVVGFLLWLFIASALLIAVVVWKGERPLGWRWDE
jgi:hypothetical protein